MGCDAAGDLRGEALMDSERRGGLGAQGSRWRAYADSKAANALFVANLARREAAAGTGVTALAVHPGVVSTNLIRYVLPESALASMQADPEKSQAAASLLGVRTPAEGAVPVVWCAAADEAAALNGGFVVTPGEVFANLPSDVRDPVLAAKLWEDSMALLGQMAA